MPAFLHSVATAVPPHRYTQERILEVMRAWHGEDRRIGRLLGGIYRASAIEGRHSVVPDFLPGDPGGFYYDPQQERFLVPSTGQRNELYRQEAGRLAICAGGRLLGRQGASQREGVSHLITVSCTGFFAPGPDIELVEGLGLRGEVERFHLGFMGCYGAFPALRLARSICLADPDAVVMIVSIELCTLHLQARSDSDSMLAASVFADGAAAALVSAQPPEHGGLRIEAFASSLVPGSGDEMGWTIGDHGFEMQLSGRIPELVECEVGSALQPLLGSAGVDRSEVAEWAVHPGGRAILDAFERSLALEEGALAASRSVLRKFGNMSSATVLFVLEELLEARPSGPLGAVAFGPGLTVESAMFTPAS